MKSLKDRFWSKVDIKGHDDCWEWTAFKDKDGYGRFRFLDSKVVASRFAWEIANKESLGDRMACHTCDNPSCCNPSHIYAGSPKTNAKDASERGRLRAGVGSGETHHSAKLTCSSAAEIRGRLANGEHVKSLAMDYGVSRAAIVKVRDFVTWKQTEDIR